MNLKNEGLKEQLQQTVESTFKQLPTEVDSVEKEWIRYRTTLIKSAEKLCGKRKNGNRQIVNSKHTTWWSEEVKQAVKIKKDLYKEWIKSQNYVDYVNYRIQSRRTNKIVKAAKKQSWERFGVSLADNHRTATRTFFKMVRGIGTRDENYNPTDIINDKNGNPLIHPSKVTMRWREYFQELLNPLGEKNKIIPTDLVVSTLDPEILHNEVDRVVRQAPKYKTPGVDRLPTEIIQATGEYGIKWLHRIFNAAWAQQRTPKDWQQAIIIPLWKNKGSKRECTQYRGIALLSHVGKMYAKIIESRLRPIIEIQLSDEQMEIGRAHV